VNRSRKPLPYCALLTTVSTHPAGRSVKCVVQLALGHLAAPVFTSSWRGSNSLQGEGSGNPFRSPPVRHDNSCMTCAAAASAAAVTWASLLFFAVSIRTVVLYTSSDNSERVAGGDVAWVSTLFAATTTMVPKIKRIE